MEPICIDFLLMKVSTDTWSYGKLEAIPEHLINGSSLSPPTRSLFSPYLSHIYIVRSYQWWGHPSGWHQKFSEMNLTMKR